MEIKKDGDQEQNSEPIIRDTYKIAYILHFILGAGNLLPWNTFITAVDYFTYLYPSKHVERVFSVAYMGSSVLVLLLMVSNWLVRGPRMSKTMSLRLRMNMGLAMFVLALMVAPIIDWADWWSARRQGSSFAMTVAAVVVCGVADGLMGGSLIGSAGKLPKEYMQAVFAGTASSGVLVSILRIITKASLPENPQGLQKSAHLYFIVSAIIVVGCMVCNNLLFTLPAMQDYYNHDIVYHQVDQPSPKLWDTSRKILWPVLGIFSIYVVTLSIFPGFIADNGEGSKALRDWYPVVLIAVYNSSDLAGKLLTGFSIPQDIGKVTWACLARVMFYPGYRACLHGPTWLKKEVSVVLLTFMLGLSNGYLTSALMILTPKSVNVLEAETAAVVMALSLGIGLVGGSILGWLWII